MYEIQNYSLLYSDLDTKLKSPTCNSPEVQEKLNTKSIEIKKKINAIKIKIREREKEIIRNAQVVATTISKVVIDNVFLDNNCHYDVVMFDEASMAYVPHTVYASSFAKEHFICVGDFRQLAPIVTAPDNELLATDIYTHLNILDNNNMRSHPWLTLLDCQRRMHPDIIALPNRKFYNNLLTSHSTIKENRTHIANSFPLSGAALQLIDLTGTYSIATKNAYNSRYNLLSAFIAFTTAYEIHRKNPTFTIGILSPYAAQVRLIRAMIKDSDLDSSDILCATVHQFQGSECDIILFDTIVSYPFNGAGRLLTNKNNPSINRLINVAITRAKGKFITISNTRFWEKTYGKDHIINSLLGEIKKKGNTTSHFTHNLAQHLSSSSSTTLIDFFFKQMDCITFLERDINSAKISILVSLPDGNLHSTYKGEISNTLDKDIYKLLVNARNRGIEIKIKSNDVSSLPAYWKKATNKTLNADYPLIIIDEKLVWYGLPLSQGKFTPTKPKGSSFITVCHIIARVNGLQTTKIIRSLSEFDYIKISEYDCKKWYINKNNTK